MPKKIYTKKARPAGLTKTQSKAVATIAKKAVMKVAETKSYLNTANSTNLTEDTVYAWNLMSGIPQGDDDDDRIGNKIMISNIYMKFQLYAYNNVTLGRGDRHFRLMLIKSKTPLTSSYTTITASDVFRSGTTTNMNFIGFPDRNKITVLYDKVIKVENRITDADNCGSHTINLKVNKTEFFETNSSLYLKNGNYYLIVVGGSGTGSPSNTSFIRFNYAINFKDC